MQLAKIVCAAAVAVSGSLLTVSTASAGIVDDFNTSAGRFTTDPDTSGTTVGLSETDNGVGPSTVSRTTTVGEIYEGAGSLKLSLTPGSYYTSTIAQGGTPQTTTGFTVRLLSGGGTPANNVATAPAGTKLGVYVATTGSNIQFAPAFDDGTTLERSQYQTLSNDGQYRLYEFDLTATDFARIAGTGGTAGLDASTVTLDSFFVNSAVAQSSPVTVLFDAVQYNTVPEPASLGLLGIAGAALLGRRRRRA
jgi:hypothetical protein